MLTRSPSASLSELDRAYAGAVAAHQAGDFEGAVRSLNAVLTDLERMPDSADAFAQWSRALLRLARAQGSLGRKADADESMKRLLRADPTVNADPGLYPPSFQRQLDEVRKQLAAAPKRKLVVKGPKGTKVFVEGREVGEAPITVSCSRPGKYRVFGRPEPASASPPGRTTWRPRIRSRCSISQPGARCSGPEGGPGLAAPIADRSKAIVTAGAALQLDQVLTATVASDGDVRFLVGTLYDVRRRIIAPARGGSGSRGSPLPEGGIAALAGFLLSGETSTLVISGGEAKPLSASGRGGVKVSSAPGGGQETARFSAGAPSEARAVTLGLAGFATYQGVSGPERLQRGVRDARLGERAPSVRGRPPPGLRRARRAAETTRARWA